MEKKLYRVEVSMTYYALAESREEAEGYATDAIDDAGVHGFSESASECKEVGHVYNFEDGELVYHDGREDIDVKQAFSMATGKDYASEIKREADAMRARMAAKVGFASGSSHGR
jgi:hypothetical protein